MTGRIVVFRFDRNPWICRARVTQLRRLNPGVRIFGLYGGAAGCRRVAFRVGSPLCWGSTGSTLPGEAPDGTGKTATWPWPLGTGDVGYSIDFDVAHLVEWDLLFLDSL